MAGDDFVSAVAPEQRPLRRVRRTQLWGDQSPKPATYSPNRGALRNHKIRSRGGTYGEHTKKINSWLEASMSILTFLSVRRI